MTLTRNTTISDRSNAPAAAAFTLRIDPNDGAFDVHTVEVQPAGITISGSDELGLIHGIYAFSEKWLGADPCQWITGIVPERGATVYLQYKYNSKFKTAYQEDLPVLAES